MPRRYWLMKVEPSAYSIDDLARDGSTSWEGVRNYQARNFARRDAGRGRRAVLCVQRGSVWGDGARGDCARGLPGRVCVEEGPHLLRRGEYPEKPLWYAVDIRFVERFPGIVSLETLKSTPGLEEMVVTKKGSRLSIQPVTKREFEIVTKLGRRKG